MTEREYRQNDQTRGYCPHCGKPVTMLGTRGYCERHGYVWSDWQPTEPAASDPRPDPRTHPEYWTE